MKQKFSKWFMATTKTKSLLVIATLFLTTAIVIQGCKKNDLNFTEDSSKATFTKEAAKEWYYGVFKKSAEYKSYNQKTMGEKQPIWETAKSHKVGDLEILEFSLVKDYKKVQIDKSQNLNAVNSKRVLENTLNHLILIKDKAGQIKIREVQIIPNFDYLLKKNYDISINNFFSLDKEFDGRVIVKDWNEAFLRGFLFEDGKIRKSYKPTSNRFTANQPSVTTESESGPPLCVDVYDELWERHCEGHYEGDVKVEDRCGEWILVSSVYIGTFCEDDFGGGNGSCADPSLSEAECMCQLLGIGCDDENPGPNPDPEPNDCEEKRNKTEQEFENYKSMDNQIDISTNIGEFNNNYPGLGTSEITTLSSNGTYAVRTGGVLSGKWKITAFFDYSYERETMLQVVNGNLKPYKTFKFTDWRVYGSGYVGNNILFESTWKELSNKAEVHYNDSPNAEAFSQINGRIRHKLRKELEFCGVLLGLDETLDVTGNSFTVFPQ
jgi:hypothetical protein